MRRVIVRFTGRHGRAFVCANVAALMIWLVGIGPVKAQYYCDVFDCAKQPEPFHQAFDSLLADLGFLRPTVKARPRLQRRKSRSKVRRTSRARRKVSKRKTANADPRGKRLRTKGTAASARSKIVNGFATPKFPAVAALLYEWENGKPQMHCTATLIGCRTVLTAAHCFFDHHGNPLPSDRFRVFFPNAGIFSVSGRKLHDDYKFGRPPADVALATLVHRVEGIRSRSVYQGLGVTKGTQADIVGYGKTEADRNNSGIKRRASMHVAACPAKSPDGDPLNDQQFTCWRPNGWTGEGGTCSGDSGGPMFTANREVLSITTGGSRLDYNNNVRYDCRDGDVPYNANLTYPKHREWIEKVAGSALSPKACGPFQPVPTGLDDADSTTEKFGPRRMIEVTASEAYDALSFVVGPDVARLVLTMNGEAQSTNYQSTGNPPGFEENEFHMLAGPGEKPDIPNAACVHTSPSPFAQCIIENPASGPWWMALRASKGGGGVQVMVTLYKSKSDS